MVKLSDLLVYKSLHGQGTDRRDVIRSQVWIFMTSSITNGIVTLTIDGVTTFLQLLDIQNERKIMYFSLNKSCGKFWHSVQDGGIVIDYEGFVHILNLFVFENRNRFALAVICCLMYHCLSVSHKWINYSHFALMIIHFNDWPPASDILSNKSLIARIYFLNKNNNKVLYTQKNNWRILKFFYHYNIWEYNFQPNYFCHW